MLVFAKGIAAGVAISLGGFLFVGSKWGATKLNNVSGATSSTIRYDELGSLVGSALFSVGLLLVCALKLMLYTGKIGLTFEMKQPAFHYVSLLTMLIANVAAAYAVGYLINYLMNNSGVSEFINIGTNVANGKLKLSTLSEYIKCSFQSIFCGSCVHLGVKCFNMFNGKWRGIIITIYSVLTFVYSGFQHCIANSFYFGLANERRKEVLINVAICVIGNSLGTIPIAMFTRTFRKLDSSDYSDSSYSISNIQFDTNNRERNRTHKHKHVDTESSSSNTETEA